MTPNHIVVIFLLAILLALFSGLFFLVKDPAKKDNRRTLRALTWRVGLQLALIAFLIAAVLMGWIKPHGLTP
jgi:hypothetical protein